MKDIKQDLIEEIDRHGGEFVIDNFNRVVRLIGVCDGQEDYYWLYFDGNDVQICSCVGGHIILKDKIDSKDYDMLIHSAKMNDQDLLDNSQTEAIRKELLENIEDEILNIKWI